MERDHDETLPEADPPDQVDEFTLVLLIRPSNAPPMDQVAIDKLQRQHLGHLEMLKKKGVLLVSGPFFEQPDQSWRGMCIYRVGVDEARRLAESDPSVRRGRLQITAFRWMTRKGALVVEPTTSLP